MSFKPLFQIDYQDFESNLADRVDSDYLRAQQDGHYKKDCSVYEAACPTSIFEVSLSLTIKHTTKSHAMVVHFHSDKYVSVKTNSFELNVTSLIVTRK